MTRTEGDLLEVLALRAESAVSEHRVLDQIELALVDPGSRPRRRAMTVISVAAVVALAAGTIVIYGRGDHGSRVDSGGTLAPTTSRATPKAFLAYSYRLDAPPQGFSVGIRQLTGTKQTVVYDQNRLPGAIAGAPDVIEAVVYAKAAFDPSSVRAGTALTVDGHPGFYGPAAGHIHESDGQDRVSVVPSIAWEYASNSWAVVTGVTAQFRGRATELALARTVHPAPAAPPKIAFSVGYLPAGLSVTQVTNETGLGSTANFGRSGSDSVVTIDVSYSPDQTVRAGFGTPTAPTTVGGYPAKLVELSEGGTVEGHQLEVIRGKFWISVGGELSVSTAELRMIESSMTLASGGLDQSTWFATTTALPH